MKGKNYFSDLSQKQLDNLLASAVSLDGKNAKELLELGANPNTSSAYGWTPLMNAAYKGDARLVKLLISYGANVNPRIFNVFIIACTSGSTEVVKILLKNGANVNAKDFYGSTPLIAGVKTGKLEIVKLFLEYGAKINACDYKGNTPLFYAMKLKERDIENFLREKGASLEASDSKFVREYDKLFGIK